MFTPALFGLTYLEIYYHTPRVSPGHPISDSVSHNVAQEIKRELS